MLLLAGEASVARGQSALDGFDPNANGWIRAIVVQPDGKILIGGDFTSLSPNGGAPVTRNHLARLNPDSTLDPSFNPSAKAVVRAIAVQADGRILAGGNFNGANSIGGQTRNSIARLDPITGLADSFDPNANSVVLSIAVQANGKILAGGSFFFIGGQTRDMIARLNTDGTADSFDPNPNSDVYVIAHGRQFPDRCECQRQDQRRRYRIGEIKIRYGPAALIGQNKKGAAFITAPLFARSFRSAELEMAGMRLSS